MKILVTGANGFIAKNLIASLNNSGNYKIYKVTRDTTLADLNYYCSKADFVYHLAGVNRPNNESEFMEGNYNFTKKLFEILKYQGSKAPVVISSSIQAERLNAYGESKLAGEKIGLLYQEESGNNVYIYRLPNVFGKWCKPNYNSVVATFCHNIARDLPITIDDKNIIIKLIYIDDLIQEFKTLLTYSKENDDKYYYTVSPIYEVSLGEIVELLNNFKKSRNEHFIPNMSNEFIKKLYSTYLSYLPEDRFKYELKMNKDDRGSFTEFIKTPDRGQVSINISKPGITKGNHWHHTKNEKFLVVSGEGVIRFRKVDHDEVFEYSVSEKKFEVIDIPVGYTHNIENLGKEDMVTIIWANEIFDPVNPDTFYEEV